MTEETKDEKTIEERLDSIEKALTNWFPQVSPGGLHHNVVNLSRAVVDLDGTASHVRQKAEAMLKQMPDAERHGSSGERLRSIVAACEDVIGVVRRMKRATAEL